MAQSAAAAPSDEARFYREALEEVAPAVGVTDAEIRAEAASDEAVDQGLSHDRLLLALLRVLERVSPFHGSQIIRFLPQAFVYFNRASATEDIDKIVLPALTAGPCIVVSHSLGTIVTFKILRDAAAAGRVPFYTTLGSPLPLKAVMHAIGPAFGRPAAVSSSLNGLDPNDAVTIGRSLTVATFGSGIDNIDDIDNGNEDPHDVRKYLRVVASLKR